MSTHSAEDVVGLLKCPVCYDYLQRAVVTKCSHTFCSLCIRKYLNFNTRCPTCYQETYESDLVKVNLIDDIVQAYKKKSANNLEKAEEQGTFSEKKINSSKSTRTDKDFKTENDKNKSLITAKGVLNTTERSGQSTELETNKTKLTQNFEEKVEAENLSLASDQLSAANYTDMDNSECNSALKASKKVTCPICDVDILEVGINLHLDKCLAGKEKKLALRRTPKRKTLQKPVYSIMSDKELKKKLKESGLSVKGDRHTLETRHKEYVTLYNAECDSREPRPVSDLIKELEKNEDLKNKEKFMSSKSESMKITKNSSPETVLRAQKEYEAKHKSQFSKLIQETRERMKKGKVSSQSPNHEKLESNFSDFPVDKSQTAPKIKKKGDGIRVRRSLRLESQACDQDVSPKVSLSSHVLQPVCSNKENSIVGESPKPKPKKSLISAEDCPSSLNPTVKLQKSTPNVDIYDFIDESSSPKVKVTRKSVRRAVSEKSPNAGSDCKKSETLNASQRIDLPSLSRTGGRISFVGCPESNKGKSKSSKKSCIKHCSYVVSEPQIGKLLNADSSTPVSENGSRKKNKHSTTQQQNTSKGEENKVLCVNVIPLSPSQIRSNDSVEKHLQEQLSVEESFSPDQNNVFLDENEDGACRHVKTPKKQFSSTPASGKKSKKGKGITDNDQQQIRSNLGTGAHSSSPDLSRKGNKMTPMSEDMYGEDISPLGNTSLLSPMLIGEKKIIGSPDQMMGSFVENSVSEQGSGIENLDSHEFQQRLCCHEWPALCLHGPDIDRPLDSEEPPEEERVRRLSGVSSSSSEMSFIVPLPVIRLGTQSSGGSPKKHESKNVNVCNTHKRKKKSGCIGRRNKRRRV